MKTADVREEENQACVYVLTFRIGSNLKSELILLLL